MSEVPNFAWAVLPTWRARYPYRYAIVLALVPALVLAPVAVALTTPALRAGVVGAIVGGGVVLLLWPLAGATVSGGVFRSPRVLRGLSSNQVLAVEPREGPWARTLVVQPVGSAPRRLPQVVSWRIWPDRRFDDTVSGLRLALGMPAEPVGGAPAPPIWPFDPPAAR